MVNDLLTSLSAYWKLDDTNDTDAVDAHDDNDGTQGGGVVDGVSGHINTCFDFDGVNDYVVIPTSAELNTNLTTFSCWVKANETSYSSDEHILNRGNTQHGTAVLFVNSSGNKITFQIRLDGDETTLHRATANDAITTDWTHVVGRFDGDNTELFINGVLQDTADTTDGVIDTDSPTDVVIGARDELYDFVFDGLIDEVGIWSIGLTNAQITQLTNSGSGLSYDSFDSAGTNAQINIADDWKTIESIQINVADDWKTIESIQINVADDWKTIF